MGLLKRPIAIVSNAVLSVFNSATPSEVGQVVVGLNVIPVKSEQTLGPGSYESVQYEVVYVFHYLFA